VHKYPFQVDWGRGLCGDGASGAGVELGNGVGTGIAEDVMDLGGLR